MPPDRDDGAPDLSGTDDQQEPMSSVASPAEDLAGQALSHPLVLKAAWMRVDGWYRRGNMAPEPELSVWRLNPEEQLRRLGSLLRNREWTPSPWTQIPYPKKGARLRHYVLPTVRDQVAFMAHMVILGPVIDSQLHPFVFGNRWYRPIHWDRTKKRPRWISLAYPLLTAKTYLPYPRDHGLFRRVANWTVSTMTKTPIESSESEATTRLPADYQKRRLPPWVRKSWWRPRRRNDRVSWAALDIELAYPSIRTDHLHRCLDQVLESFRFDDHLFRGFPSPALNVIQDADSLRGIGQSVIEALQRVEVPAVSIPTDSWRSPHARSQWDPDDIAVPTGLAISGVLLNATLHPTDRGVLLYLKKTTDEERGAFLRFADDMYVFSRSTTSLLKLMEIVSRELENPEWLRIDRSQSPQAEAQQDDRHYGPRMSSVLDPTATPMSNLYLNLDKVRPKPIKDLLERIRKDSGWKKCPVCAVRTSDAPARRAEALDQWWAVHRKDEELSSLSDALFRESVGQEETGPFVTTLVERMSEIGWGGLRERFGEGARGRLQRLHELARFDIDDEQVAPDTRQAFAVNRLVNAWLPDDSGGSSELRAVRRSVAEVLERTPWKFALWTAVVRAAARLAETADSKTDPQADGVEAGARWLEGQLRRIAVRGDGDDRRWWGDLWPEMEIDKHCRGDGWRDQYLSFVRASFWKGLRTVTTELWTAVDLRDAGGDTETDFGSRWRGLSPDSWCYRAIPEGRYRDVLTMLRNTDRWVRVLYPEPGSGDGLARRVWELDQLVAAVLAATPRSDAITGWMRSQDAAGELCVPDALLDQRRSETAKVLRRSGRVVPESEHADELELEALARVYLAGRDESGRKKLVRAGVPSVRGWKQSRAETVRRMEALGSNRRLSAGAMGLWVKSPEELVQTLTDDPLYLEEYSAVRRVLLGGDRGVLRTGRSLHRLLWGVPDDSVDFASWRLSPWEVPAVGLPVRVAVGLVPGEAPPSLPWGPAAGPLTWSVEAGASLLARGRQLQFLGHDGGRDGAMPGATDPDGPDDDAVRVGRSEEWEVPPHGAYFLPFVHSGPDDIDRAGYALYCDVLLFLTALDGGEKILTGIQETGAGNVPFAERWSWRSRLHLVVEAWTTIERVIRWSERPQGPPTEDGEEWAAVLRRALAKSVESGGVAGIDDYGVERVDLRVDSNAGVEIVRMVRRAGEATGPLPEQLELGRKIPTEEVRVRIGQVIVDVGKSSTGWLGLSHSTRNKTMEQVFQAFLTPSYGHGTKTPQLVVLPELVIPQEEVATMRTYVGDTGLAALAGLYWRELGPAYAPTSSSRMQNRWLVNEAEIVIPIGYGDRGPTSVRWYRVRKPLPTHMEAGLVRALECRVGGCWKMLPGRRWYRFVHSKWGDFTVAICSDLIDAAPWRSLRGEILHLFVVAHNRDVDLYDVLTWARAYENFANLVAVNAGNHGGSLVWVPRRNVDRELARFRGRGLNVVADVNVPVRGLLRAQVEGVREAVSRARQQWEEKTPSKGEFKAPPPGYVRRALRDSAGAGDEGDGNEE